MPGAPISGGSSGVRAASSAPAAAPHPARVGAAAHAEQPAVALRLPGQASESAAKTWISAGASMSSPSSSGWSSGRSPRRSRSAALTPRASDRPASAVGDVVAVRQGASASRRRAGARPMRTAPSA